MTAPMRRMAMGVSRKVMRGREMRSSRRKAGMARPTARSTSVRAMERFRSCRGSQGASRPKTI